MRQVWDLDGFVAGAIISPSPALWDVPTMGEVCDTLNMVPRLTQEKVGDL